ncbi:DgyrCDS10086 [Dimorphilus gyrociliatus]|uniref:DgyrCDS10086 n=1 Tax=Dimorphilus gyrociliatus TaxID=2664684 RepID=A0A7I8VZ76_9ANNE|nr:DgyrCDS10086 [Dimorphilus gyrociliatus]
MTKSYQIEQISDSSTTTDMYQNSPIQNDNEKPVDTLEKKDEKEEKKKEKAVSITELYRYATTNDKLILFLGVFCGLGSGALQPVMFLFFGEMTNSFMNVEPVNGTISDEMREQLMEKLMKDMKKFSIYYVGFGAASFILSYAQFACFLSVSYRIAYKIRVALFGNIIHQEISWYDTNDTGELNTRLTDDVNKIQEGIGDKVGMIFQSLAMFIGGFSIGFAKGWKLTLVILAISPVLAIMGGITAKIMGLLTKKELGAYAKAGSVAEEVISSIRTVMAFSGQKKEITRYEKNLVQAKDFGIRKGIITGSLMGSFNVIIFGMMALAFWFGGKLVRDDNFEPGNILTVFFAVVIAAFSLGMLGPNIEALTTARGAAYVVFDLIDRQSKINSDSTVGSKPKIYGNIEFRDVKFKYPSRPDVQVLNGINIKVEPGKTLAFVGSSGCGKSTTVQLIQRFYDCEEGQILIDGTDIKEINVEWLRKNIGVVSQEPILFDCSIEENIRLGRDDVTEEEIRKAAKDANAYDFIKKLPKQFNTLVGERGAQLSGGQKQRIAIARALVRQPVILLLDEATSALDMESEAVVQDALNKASAGRTTIVIAHRLSTIKTANRICAFEGGRIVEEGTHSELMEMEDGIYHKLVSTQQNKTDEQEEETVSLDSYSHEKRRRFSSISTISGGSTRMKHPTSLLSYGSVTPSMHDAQKLETTDEEELGSPSLGRIFRLNSPEINWIILGCVGALGVGSVQPAFAVIFGDILKVLTKPKDQQAKDIAFYCGMFVVMGVGSGIMKFLQDSALGVSGGRLTMRLRKLTFTAFMKQDIPYYDKPQNSTGALTTRLATDASAVQGATGSRLGIIIQSFGTLGIGIILGFVYNWKLTLVLLAFVPFLILGGSMEMVVMMGIQGKSNKNLEEAGKISTQCIENIRTVAQLCKEKYFKRVYYNFLGLNHKSKMKKIHLIGLGFGLSQSVFFFAFAACFTFGAHLIKVDGENFQNVFKVFSAVAFGAQAIGEVASFAPNYGKAKVAAARLFKLFDRVPGIDSFSPDGMRPKETNGVVEFKAVRFNYPTRPDLPVLRGLNIKVETGQTLALVGSSGCGKSTTISLLERFYNPLSGSVTIDGLEISSLNIEWARQQMGLVQQEPILFDCTIGENIAYGDNSRVVSQNEIIEAAQKANIHNFICSLPNV